MDRETAIKTLVAAVQREVKTEDDRLVVQALGVISAEILDAFLAIGEWAKRQNNNQQA